MTDAFLHRYFLANAEKPIHKWLHYFDIYSRHFARFRGHAPVVLEIGVQGGGSLAMWKAYFGEGCTILGLDVDPTCKAHESDGIEVFIGSQDDLAVIDAIFARHPRIDIVLDDGSHLMSHMRASFDLMYARMHAHGVYVVEDTHTCYWPEFGGGVRASGSFMEFVKDRLDALNAVHTRGAIAVSAFTASTDCIACYDSVVVFERRPQGSRQAPITIGMARATAEPTTTS